MNWTEFLTTQAEEAYDVVNKLVAKLDEESLSWKPESGENWMTVGQLLEHIKMACGACMFGFVTGDWSAVMPEGDMDPSGEMPTADKLPTCPSIDDFKAAFEKDRELAFSMIEKVGEEDLTKKLTAAPWNPVERTLGVQFNECVAHLNSHKAQLFYYLKLQGHAVGTMDLWNI